MGLNLSDKELDAMDGLPHLHRCLYIFGIRRYMDYKTGVTGIKREISYKSLAEEIYEEPIAGIKMTAKSRDQIKRALTVLEKKGLIKRQSIIKKDEKILILSCPLAKRDESVQNKAAPWPPHSPAPQAAPVENVKNNIETNTYDIQEQESRPESRPADFEKAARHPLSVIDNITLPSASDFLNLLAKQGYYLNQLHSNKKTLAMVSQWVEARITLEEAEIGIKHANAMQSPKPDSPAYYLKPVLQVRQDFERAKKQANEVNHAKPHSTQNPSQRHPKSATRQFWENAEDIMRGLTENEN